MAIIPSQRHLFDIPEDVTYLNCAYMSPLMKAAADAGKEGVQAKTRPWEITPDDFFETTRACRSLAGDLIDAPAHNMAIVPSASYALATAAKNLSVNKGSNLIALKDQFPSNIYVWKKLAAESEAEFRLLPLRQDGDWTATLLDSIDEQSSIVALPHCHWTDGALVDLINIGKRCREVGAALVLDLTQSAGALPISMKDVDPDFAVFAAYKWAMGPYSLGFMYVADRHLQGSGLEENWIARKDSANFAGLVDYKDEYQPGAERFDVGERSNFHLMPIARRAMEQIKTWGVENIYETLAQKNKTLVKMAEPLGLKAAPDHLRAGHYLGLRFPGEVPEGLVDKLAREKIYVSLRGTSMRVTPHLYNSEDDLGRLIEALSEVS